MIRHEAWCYGIRKKGSRTSNHLSRRMYVRGRVCQYLPTISHPICVHTKKHGRVRTGNSVSRKRISTSLLRTAFCPEIFVLIRQRDMPHFAMPAGAFHGGFWLGSRTGRLPLQGLARIKHELYLLLSEHMAYCSVRSSLQVVAKSPDGTMFLDLSNEPLFVPYACSYPYCLRPALQAATS